MKPSPETLAALQRLRNHQDFRVFEKHITERLNYIQQALVTTPAGEIAQLQGRALELRDILKL